MFITKNLILLEYPKAASSFLRGFLRIYFNSKIQKKGVHNPITSSIMYNKIEENEIKVLGSVRNPFSFYVSLRSFTIQNTRKDGLDTRIGLNRSLFTKPGLKSIIRNPLIVFRDLSDWKGTYDDPYDEESFQKWLKLFIDKKSHHVHPLYKKVSHLMGYATYLYFFLYTKNFKKNFKYLLEKKVTLDDYYEKYKFPIVIVKTEDVRENMIDASQKLGLDKEKVSKILIDMLEKKKNFNASNKKKYTAYYSKENIELVQEKDKWLLKKFNYII
jgi:hypothetical protein